MTNASRQPAPQMRAIPIFLALTATATASAAIGPIGGVACGVVLVPEATGQRLTPLHGALLTGAIATLLWLIF